MLNFLILAAIGILFYLLAKSADLIIDSTRKIGHYFLIPTLFLGFFLGFLTSLPELSIAVSASAREIGDLALGNLLGGIIVLFGLVLGLSIISSRPISTDGNYKTISPILIYSFLPFIFGTNGEISFWEGLLLIIGYVALVFYLSEKVMHPQTQIPDRRHAPKKQFIFVFIGITALLVISNLIVRLTEALLEGFDIPAFVVGIILFSLGTNLPEITLSLRAIRKKAPDLSLASIFGSVITNPIIVGVLALIQPIPITSISQYMILTTLVLLLFVLVLRFYKTQKRFTKKEGVILLLLYILIISTQLFFV